MGMPAEIVLIDPNPALPYTGMVPGYIAGVYDRSDILIDLVSLCARATATFTRARGVAIDTRSRLVHCNDGSAVGYDVLSIDIGSTLDTAVPGVVEHALCVRPLWRFVSEWPPRMVSCQNLVVVGAGAAGIELALAVHGYGYARGKSPSITVVGDAPSIAPALAPRARIRLRHACESRGIRLELGARLAGVTPRSVRLDSGATLAAHTVLWATGPAPHGWLRETGLELDERGYLAVDDCLRVGGRPDVYAAGDVASIVGYTRPKAGVYAVREAPVLAENLERALRGERPRRYVPQRLALALIGTADCRAVGAYGPLSVEGEWVWRWKDAIDRKFVQRYRA
jgi:selenide,water dikinase